VHRGVLDVRVPRSPLDRPVLDVRTRTGGPSTAFPAGRSYRDMDDVPRR
jgi:hypothetical protein